MRNLALYYGAYCPYCQKVLRFMEEQGIVLELRNTAEAQNRDELLRVGGKNQVPCLFIDGKALYESDDIIAFLRTEFAV